MKAIIKDKKLLIITKPKSIHSDLLTEIKKLKLETDVIIKHNEILAENTIKTEIIQLLTKYKHKDDNHEHEKR